MAGTARAIDSIIISFRYGIIAQKIVCQAWIDFACESCEMGESPEGWSIADREYTLTDYPNGHILIQKSPYYTMIRGVPSYCLGHEWFDDGQAPYTIYSVETHQQVTPLPRAGDLFVALY